MVPFIRHACQEQHQVSAQTGKDLQQGSGAEKQPLPLPPPPAFMTAEAYPGHFGRVHERLDGLEAAVARIEAALSTSGGKAR